ncbi:hypothetical protein [Haloarchaeobius iranensis]|uniref:Uncharacterized protein n=1 Tax=Haloarchaeobius iranensis TaxID=996166 RepID=A0A1G9XY90_9EURY|nr:hypothetical protein [Haloarchaeobius iranensis]SDN01728.1 hypothetical protein SAMN05192554_11241 [Haloarchaeobius iranensis]
MATGDGNQGSSNNEENSSNCESEATAGDDSQDNQTEEDVSLDWIQNASSEDLEDLAVETEALQVVRKESREVLSERIRLLKDIDDKAMRTVRTSVLFIGLVISAVQVSDGSLSDASVGTLSFQFGVGGVTLLLLSIISGVFTYSASDPDFGVSDGHRFDVIQGEYTEKEWLLFQLVEYNQWIGNMRQLNNDNVVLLHLTLFTATAGVISLLFSVVFSVGWELESLISPVIVAVLITLGVLAVLRWSRSD